jgi:hypothetical protein
MSHSPNCDKLCRGFYYSKTGILYDPRMFNCKDGVKDRLKLPSYGLAGARSPGCNIA